MVSDVKLPSQVGSIAVDTKDDGKATAKHPPQTQVSGETQTSKDTSVPNWLPEVRDVALTVLNKAATAFEETRADISTKYPANAPLGQLVTNHLARQAAPLVALAMGNGDGLIDRAQNSLEKISMGAAFVPVVGEASNLADAASALVDTVQAGKHGLASILGDKDAAKEIEANLVDAGRRGAFSVPFLGNFGQMAFAGSLMAKMIDAVGPTASKLIDDLGLIALREAAQRVATSGVSKQVYEEAMELSIPMLKVDVGNFGHIAKISKEGSLPFKRLLGDTYTAESLIKTFNRTFPDEMGAAFKPLTELGRRPNTWTKAKFKEVADQFDAASARLMNAAAKKGDEHKAFAEYISTLAAAARAASSSMAEKAGDGIFRLSV
jgi:hypothetical protein